MPAVNQHRKLQEWVEEIARLCQPEHIVWIDGSEEEQQRLTQEAAATGEVILLNQDKLPGCLYHRTAANDVARTEDLTYICTPLREDAGPTNNWMSPEEGYRRASEILRGAMGGRTMYVIPFSMGPVGSPFSKIGVELTDSIYVVLNMRIMTHVGAAVLKQLGAGGEFTRCLHSKADLDIQRRLILHFPEDNTVWSVGSGYGGNVLLGKKCLALRIASHLSRREGWLAEHMLIMGVESPDGRVEYIAAAFPSACGKTNLAMMVPPEGLLVKGYRIWTVGDDIAWMRIDTDGRLWAINPETGFFGVGPGTNLKTNPNMMKTIRHNTIYTNVVLAKDGTVWWEGGEGPPPEEALDWQGRPWKPGMKDQHGKPVLGAHPNSRFTTPLSQCPSASFRTEHHHGVPISAVVFGGRRAHLAPLVYEAFDWEHGVFVGATMASERTAAQFGKQGEVRRDPMAMLPFCGYHMGDYFEHWLTMGKRMNRPPKIFHVNWFRSDEQGKMLWPGYGENLRIIEWILDRCRGEADAVKTPIGYLPTPDSLDLTGLDISRDALDKLFAINRADWFQETENVTSFFQQFGNRLPRSLWDQLESLRLRLRAPIALMPPGADLRPLAAELNEVIERENPHVYGMLSGLGKRLFFPKGILAQAAEAKEKAKHHDATIGIARENGKPMHLASVMRYFNDLSPAEALTYAPATGRPDLRKKWREDLLRKNPSLAGKSFSLPIVTSGVTHALSLVADLFVDKGDMVLMPDKFWENYELLFGVRYQAQLAIYPFYDASGRFNVEALRQALAHPGGKLEDGAGAQFPQQSHGLFHHPQRRRAGRLGALGGRPRRPQPGGGLRRRLLRAVLRRRRLRGVALRPAGRRPRADPGREGRRPHQGGVRLGLPHWHVDLRHAGLLQRRRALCGPGKEGRRRDPQRDLQLLARRPVGVGQIAGHRRASGRAAAEEGDPRRPGQARPCDPCVARVCRPLGALPLQLRLLHVPEAQRDRRRALPQAPAGQLRRGRDRRWRPRHPHRLFGRGSGPVGRPLRLVGFRRPRSPRRPRDGGLERLR